MKWIFLKKQVMVRTFSQKGRTILVDRGRFKCHAT